MNERLLNMARANLDSLSGASLEKQAFEPMPAGDFAAMGAPPMDPSMAGTNPAAAGAGPAASSPPPAAANVPPVAPSSGGIPPEVHDALISVVRQVVQEMGVGGAPAADSGGGGGGDAAKPAQDMEARLGAVEGALAQVLEQLGLANPQQALTDAVTEAAPAAGMTAGAGAPDDGGEAQPMPAMGPMSPGAAGAFGEVDVPSTVGGKKVSFVEAPLDRATNAVNVANAINVIRERKGL